MKKVTHHVRRRTSRVRANTTDAIGAAEGAKENLEEALAALAIATDGVDCGSLDLAHVARCREAIAEAWRLANLVPKYLAPEQR